MRKIRYTPGAPSGELIEAGGRVAASSGSRRGGEAEQGVGFSIIHAGADLGFVLFAKWVNTNELILLLWHKPFSSHGDRYSQSSCL